MQSQVSFRIIPIGNDIDDFAFIAQQGYRGAGVRQRPRTARDSPVVDEIRHLSRIPKSRAG